MIKFLRMHPTTGKFSPGYYVLSESRHYKKGRGYVRKNLGGPYKSLQPAKIRLRQVEAFKHMR